MKYFLIILSLGFFSCASLEKIKPNDNLSLNTLEELKVLNGDYRLVKKSPNTCSGLEAAFEFENEFNCINKPDSDHFMRLTVVSKNEIKAQLFHGKELLEEKRLKGKIKQNYYKVKASFKILMSYIIINGYRSTTVRFGILPDGNLTVDFNRCGCFTLTFFPLICADGESYGDEYQKIIAF